MACRELKRMRAIVGLTCLALAAAMGLGSFAFGQGADKPDGPDQSLRLYAVNVVQVPRQTWTGRGVYLGNGLVLTAAHVVANFFWKSTKVEINGKELAVNVLKKGSFPELDLALLSVDLQQLPVSLRLRRMPICQNNSYAGEEVIVATPEGIARSRVVAPVLLPKNVDPKFRTAIADVASTGNSGSGVFDAQRGCLLGIVSGKIYDSQLVTRNNKPTREQKDIAKFFVPAPVIRKFIPPEYPF
jgi:S1-C subfamily serine protease